MLRNPAQARATERANKAASGTRRQTVLTSVLESLRQYLPDFTLGKVVEERHPETGLGVYQYSKPVRRQQPPETDPLPTGSNHGDRAENQFGAEFGEALPFQFPTR